MARETYRFDKDAGKCIPKSEWIEKYGKDDVVRPTVNNIIKDIEPYQSTIDGSMITSRSHHRNHLKDHGYEEIGTENVDDAKKHFERPDTSRRETKEAVIDAYNKLEQTSRYNDS